MVQTINGCQGRRSKHMAARGADISTGVVTGIIVTGIIVTGITVTGITMTGVS